MVLTALLALASHGGTEPVADFKLTDPNALGQVQGPETLKNSAGARFALTRKGRPRYMNVPPDSDDGRALLFDGRSSYVLKAKLPIEKGFILETWCRAAKANDKGLHGVASMGDGGRGYSIVQQGSNWGIFVGGHGFVSAGPVKAGAWTHVALVFLQSGQGTVYLDGVKRVQAPSTSGMNANFSIGDMGGGREHFAGDISRVRLSQIGAKGFELKKDLLLDFSVIEKAQKESAAAAQKRIKAILKGVKTTDSIKVSRYDGDWLVKPPTTSSSLQVTPSNDGRSAELVLGNGLVTRKFYLGENLVCFSLKQEPANLEFLRSIKPEATVTVGGKKIAIGGLRFPSMATGRKGRGASKFVGNFFLKEWLGELVPDPNAFTLVRISTAKPKAWLKWKPMQKGAMPWPPKGLTVNMVYEAPGVLSYLKGLKVTVHYEIYDGIPVIGKWLSFEHSDDQSVDLEQTLIEELAVADNNADKVFIESEYNHFHATPVRWYVDPEFKTDSGPIFTERMADYRLRFWNQQELKEASTRFDGHPEWQGEYRSRSLLQVQYPEGPAKEMKKGETWKTFRSWMLLQDNMDEERKGLGRRKLYRTIMPWTNENLVYMHVLSHKTAAIKQAVDQCAECGFDMIILTFGSGFNMMSKDKQYKARIKEAFDYAHSKGIKTGAYILFCSSRSYGNGEHDAKPAAYGRSLCLGSAFADKYFKQILGFMKEVGMDCIETDGPYHGYRCERTGHPLHKGRADSWRVNWEQQEKFYRMCMDQDIYIITPDWYFASGGRKTPMGYKESNWTLPRPQQALVARQNIYDGTWWRTASMCYHALPLTSVYGGGQESTMEPLSEHLDSYDRVLAQYFGMGIMACYRGYRLYDTDKTKAVVKGWVDFFNRHRAIIESDIIHVRRPDGRDLDCMMHANAALEEKGMAFIFNPTRQTIKRNFALPLHYTGLTRSVRITVNTGFKNNGKAVVYKVQADGSVAVPVSVQANSYIWLLIKGD